VLGLKAVNVPRENTLAQEQVTAASQGEGAGRAGRGGIQAARRTGRIVSYGAELILCTARTGHNVFAGSFEAYSRDYQRAVELDPNFALGYLMAGNMSMQDERRREYLIVHSNCGEHASEREKLTIEGGYYRDITGELDKRNEHSEKLLRVILGSKNVKVWI